MANLNKYSNNAVKAWFSQTLGINSEPAPGELQTHCPECGSDVFYWNYFKRVGVCHKANCDYRPTLWDLIEVVGYAPDETGFYEPTEVEDKEEPTIEMPGHPLVAVLLGKLMTSNSAALEYVRSRNIPDEVTLNWGLTSDGERVYVPITSNGEVKNYNSRILPGVPGMKYKYHPGAKTKTHILGWEECQLWDRLSLIENTFVSLSVRGRIQASTVFGSSLSDEQADMIAKSRIKVVAILWDEGTEKKAEKAIKKLHSRGVKAAYWMIDGQPDDHPIDWVVENAEKVYQAASEGTNYIELRGDQ